VKKLLLTCRDLESVERHYIPALRMGGWTAEIQVLVPGETRPLSLEPYTALVLTGGGDIHPKHWDPTEPIHPSAKVDADRDALEIPLAQEAWERGLAILAICRGEQLLNVALGGSLIQDIPSHFGCEPELHRKGSSDDPVICHRVRIEANSRLARTLGSLDIPVNSRHHQAALRVAPGLKAVAWHEGTAKDGEPLIEGLEPKDPERKVLAVQWHPENLVGQDSEAGEAARRLFRAFVEMLGA
jgi:putative glutamine amidotransferase